MKQFALYKNENKRSNKTYPYFVDVQNEILDDLNTRVVIPLSNQKKVNNIVANKLCPLITLDDGIFILLTHQITTVPANILHLEKCSLEKYRYEILGAIDLLITGI